MRFLTKLVTTTVGVVCTTASAYLFIDEKKRHGILFAATISQTSNNSTNTTDVIQSDQQSLSSPIKSSEPWNWNWDGLVRIIRFILSLFSLIFYS